MGQFAKVKVGVKSLQDAILNLDSLKQLDKTYTNKNEILKALIVGYLSSGGYQMQITCTSLAMLMEAYNNKDMHKNLVVRVGGYSEYFHNLSDELKKMIISRTIQKMV